VQQSCGLGFVSQKNSAHPFQQLPTAIRTDHRAIVAVLVLGSGCCSVAAVHDVGGCFCFMDSGEGWGSFGSLVSWDHVTGMPCLLLGGKGGREGFRKERKKFDGKKCSWMNKKPQTMGYCRLQKGKKVNRSKPKSWLFCTLNCPG